MSTAPELFIQHHAIIDSTNELALQLARAGAKAWTVVVSDVQTGGHGQRGRVFASPPGGLYCSFILHPLLDWPKFPLITLAAGIACCRLITAHCPLQPRVKWPNDVYLGSKKVAGILTEAGYITRQPFVVLGLGLNVNSRIQDFPAALQPRLTSLHEACGFSCQLIALLQAYALFLQDALSQLQNDLDSLLRSFADLDLLRGRSLRFQQGGATTAVSGTGAGISRTGAYRIWVDGSIDGHSLRGNHEIEIMAGDVTPIFH